MARRISSLLLLGALAGCAHHRVAEVAPSPPPALVEAPPPAPPPLSPINANLSPAATIWHLRAGLNVAALACRGPEADTIVTRYNALLSARKAELAQAQASVAAEYRVSGGKWQARQDDDMTRLYNFFSTSRARERFCAAAAAVLADVDALASNTLADFAAARLPAIDAPFVEERAPATVAIATATTVAPAPSAPRLSLDLTSLAIR